MISTVALGGGFGALVRNFLSERLNSKFPWGTFIANVTGSFILGWVFASELSLEIKLLLGAGFCGGLTTVSGFALEIVFLNKKSAITYFTSTIIASILAIVSGLELHKYFLLCLF